MLTSVHTYYILIDKVLSLSFFLFLSTIKFNYMANWSKQPHD